MSKCPYTTAIASIASIAAAVTWWIRRKPKKSLKCVCADGKEWFAEISEEMWPGQAMTLAVKKVVFQGRSQYQDIAVFDSETFGRVLTLDGVIQLTTRDEHAYQETLAHTPMQLVHKPKRALVIGGGDGGVLRELARYKCLEEIHICELDEMVIEVSKKYIQQTAVGFSDPRVRVHIEDGFTFLDRAAKEGQLFDVIVSDLSDPVGPAEAIFTEGFMELVHRALTPNGCGVMQAESMWLHGQLIKKLVTSAQKLFKDAKYATMSIPTYPCGQIGALIMSKNPGVKVEKAIVTPDDKVMEQLKYYTPEVHAAQFSLPKFVNDQIYS